LRKDISAYERGVSYTRWLRSGHFSSQEDLADALGVSGSQVSRMLRIARLPAVVVDAFRSANEICEIWGLEVMNALEDRQKRATTIRTARSLAKHVPRLQGADVYRKLVASSARGPKPTIETHDRVVLNEEGEPLFRVRFTRSAVVVVLPESKVTTAVLKEIQTEVGSILESSAVASRQQHSGRAPETQPQRARA
jgi:ParB family transcriptional regulator, chromosome partitioning protein